MNFERDDDLDRLLFSLPLEDPPADLRSSILAGTIYRPPVMVKAWELWVIGVLLAVGVWLGVLIFQGGLERFAQTGMFFASGATHLLLAQNTWLWIAVGMGITAWLTLFNASTISFAGTKRLIRR